jgi:hypothetical protein
MDLTKPQLTNKQRNHLTEIVLIVACVGWLAYTLFLVIMQTRSLYSDNSTNLPNTPKFVPPTLKLNNSHQRQGQPIVVDPNLIGKSDPFQN